MSNVILQCSQLTKTFHDGKIHVDVLRGINLQVKAGEQVAIVGSSGSGKSTLLHLLGGLDKPTQGEVVLHGHDMAKISEKNRCALRNHELGFVYQFHHLLPEFTALENVCMPLLIGHKSPKEAKALAQEMIVKVGLEKRQLHKVSELSGGERQRIAIARALVTKPSCVLADEPTGNLDNKTSHRVYETMLELNRELATSFVIVTHDPQLAQAMDTVYHLENGVLI